MDEREKEGNFTVSDISSNSGEEGETWSMSLEREREKTWGADQRDTRGGQFTPQPCIK